MIEESFHLVLLQDDGVKITTRHKGTLFYPNECNFRFVDSEEKEEATGLRFFGRIEDKNGESVYPKGVGWRCYETETKARKDLESAYARIAEKGAGHE